MKRIMVFLILLYLAPASYAEVICFESKIKPNEVQLVKLETICLDVGDGVGSNPILVGGNGGCGGSAACGGNHQEVPKLLLDHSKDLQLIMKDYKVNIQQNIQR